MPKASPVRTRPAELMPCVIAINFGKPQRRVRQGKHETDRTCLSAADVLKTSARANCCCASDGQSVARCATAASASCERDAARDACLAVTAPGSAACGRKHLLGQDNRRARGEVRVCGWIVA